MNISDKMKNMEASSVRKLTRFADQAKAAGKKVYHLNIGQPDLATPENYFNRIKAYNEKSTEYMPSLGMSALIEEIRKYYSDLGIDYKKEEIAVTTGGTEALLFTFLALTNEGDEIMLPEPFYSNYLTFFTISGARCIPVTTCVENGFHFTREDLEAKVSNHTKAILISNPCNPTGVSLTMGEVEMIADFAKSHDLFIIADEVYREFVFDGRPVSSFGFVPGIDDRLIMIDSVSKRYNACGARIGALLTKNTQVFAVISKLCQGRLSCSTLEQVGAIGLYASDRTYLTKARDVYQGRRDLVYRMLRNVPGIVCSKSEGAFYMIAKLPVPDVEDFLTWLLTSFEIDGETVMAAPASGFYQTPCLGRNEIRIAYVLAEAELKKAVDILIKGLEKYTKLL